MTNTTLALKTVQFATLALQRKARATAPVLRRAVAERIHLKQYEGVEQSLVDVLAPMFEEQVRSAAGRLRKLEKGWIEKNCGIGPGGFQPGNTCARGGGFKFSGLSEGDESKIKSALGFSLDEVASLAGALPGAKVHIRYIEDMQTAFVQVSHDRYEALRKISKNKIENSEIKVYEKGGGLGTKIFTSQVQAAVAKGINRIEANCASSEQYNGGYTWARLGYDGFLSESVQKNLQTSTTAPEWLKNSITVHQLLTKPGGREWWKENHESFRGTFDLTEGSKSRKLLQYYLEERERNAAGRQKSGTTAGAKSGGRGSPGQGLGPDNAGRGTEEELKNCGAGAPGAPGFSQGNTCARGGGWSPSMSREDAEKWANDSQWKEPHYHATSSWNVESIQKEGFRPGPGTMGSGVYFSLDGATSAATGASKGSEAVVETRVLVKNPLEVDLRSGGIQSWMQDESYRIWNDLAKAGAGGEEGRLNLLNAGYDALSVKFGTTEYRLVLDPKAIVVVKDEEKSTPTQTKASTPQPSASKLANQIFNPDDWNEELINRILPPLAKAMFEAASAQLQVMEIGAEKAVLRAIKNCGAGAPGAPGFQPGNQCARGGGGTGRLAPMSSSEEDEFFEELESGVKNIDRRLRSAVLDYIGDTASRINTALRKGQVSDNDRRIVRRLDRAIEEVWTSKDNVPLFRGIDSAPEWEKISNLSVGDLYRDKAFLSTSTDPKVANAAAGSGGVIEILAKKGQNMYPAAGIGESEVLLPRRLRMRITHIDREAKVVVMEIEQEAPKSTSTQTKASTASEWLDDEGWDLDDVVFRTPYGNVSMRFATEYPQWMKNSIQERLRETFDQPYWADVNTTTLGDIEGYLKRGLEDGWSIDRMAKEMADQLLQSGNQYGYNRGRLIARTEAGNALNGARVAAIDQLAAELGGDIPLRKLWLSVLGTTTRETHANLDGVPADSNGNWYLGGILCRWPGDVRLPANERCNCMCSISTEFGLLDADAEQLIGDYRDRLLERAAKAWLEKNCGAGAPGAPGFSQGNTCARGGGGARDSSAAYRTGVPILKRDASPSEVEDARKEWAKNRPEGYADAIDGWIRGNYKGMRKAQAGETVVDPLGRDMTATYRAQMETIDEALKTAPRQQAVIYRGLHGLDASVFSKYTTKGEVFEIKAMESYSERKEVTKKFANPGKATDSNRMVVFKLDTDSAVRIGGAFAEAEFVMPKGAKLRVKKVAKGKSDVYAEVELEVVQ